MTASTDPQSVSLTLDWLQTVPDAIRERVRQLAASHGLQVGPELVVAWGLPTTRYLMNVVNAGGSWQRLSEAIEWHTSSWLTTLRNSSAMRAGLPEMVIGEGRELSVLEHSSGVYLLRLEDAQAVMAGGYAHTPNGRQGVTAFFGESLQEVQALRAAVERRSREGHVMVWGSSSSRLDPEPVASEDVILPEPAKGELFGWLDRFCTLQGKARELRLRLRQGLLLVGPPGTGKTQLVRHLLRRYPGLDAHVFMPGKQSSRHEDPFGSMLDALRESTRAAIVTIEDIDQITSSGAVTREFLLNAIDGLFETRQPVLWVATANDPTGLDPAILDRPGRFGRIVVFNAPDAAGRRQMFRRFSRFPISDDTTDLLAGLADGLTGAYLREACTAAALHVLDSDCAYETALEAEIAVLQQQHGEAVRMGRELARGGRAGFVAQ